jgi:hypothetical protein
MQIDESRNHHRRYGHQKAKQRSAEDPRQQIPAADAPSTGRFSKNCGTSNSLSLEGVESARENFASIRTLKTGGAPISSPNFSNFCRDLFEAIAASICQIDDQQKNGGEEDLARCDRAPTKPARDDRLRQKIANRGA